LYVHRLEQQSRQPKMRMMINRDGIVNPTNETSPIDANCLMALFINLRPSFSIRSY